MGHSHRALGVVAQRQTWHAERGALFLRAARIGEHSHALVHQPDELVIAERLEKPEPRPSNERRRRCRLRHRGTGPRVHGEEHRNVASRFGDRSHQPLERRWIVHVGGAVQRQERVLACRDPMPLGRRETARAVAVRQQRIDHHVADEVDPLGRDALALEVIVRRRVRS